jgi:recombination directionality factor gp3-like protein
MSRIIPLDTIPGRMPRIGKISAGYMDVKTIQGRTVTFPAKSRTLVFRCADPAVLRQAQAIVGGAVSRSPNPRAEGVWRLISEASELQVVIATDDRRDAPARYEAWGTSGKLRDCDGRTCRFVIDPKSGERQDNVPCWCAAHDLAAEDPEACRITTRLNLLIPSFAAILGIGVWQLESRGRTTFADLKGLRELFQRLDLPGAMGTPVTLRVDIVRGRSPRTSEPWEFPVFRFQSHLSLAETVAGARAFAAAVDPARLPPPDDSAPPLGAALTPDEQALSSTAPLADHPTTRPRSVPGTGAATPRPAQSQATSAVPVERPPVPEPVGAPAPPLQESTGNGPAASIIAPVAPITEDIAKPAEDAEPIKITPAEQAALATLISQAALADGFKGKGYVRAWLQTHYKIDVSDIAGIPPKIRARVRAHALSVLERREQETPPKAPAPTTPP